MSSRKKQRAAQRAAQQAAQQAAPAQPADIEIMSGPRGTFWAALIIIVAGSIAYWPSLDTKFFLDDFNGIVDNPAVKHILPLWPGPDGTRPLTGLTFSINYAMGGVNPWDYHLTNLLIHLASALALFALLRLTLRKLESPAFRKAASPLAFIIGLLWVVHPIETEAVTYIVQRSEELFSLFYILCIYAVARRLSSTRKAEWNFTALFFCFLAMMAKPVAAPLPVMVLIYDRTFSTETFASALKRSWRMYLGMALCWALLVAMFVSSRVETIPSFSARPPTWWEYLRTQPEVILRYLRLSFWPDKLRMDYGWPVEMNWAAIVFPGIAVLILLGMTVWAMARDSKWGAVGAWFFGALAVTSSFVPIPDLYFEHRMYLAVGAVIASVVLGTYWLISRLSGPSRKAAMAAGIVAVLAAAGGLGWRTWVRNVQYANPMDLIGEVARERPDFLRGQTNMAVTLTNEGRPLEAIPIYERILEKDPTSRDVLLKLAGLLQSPKVGRPEEAVMMYKRLLLIYPLDSQALYELGTTLAAQGKYDEALSYLKEAVRLAPDKASFRNNYASCLTRTGHPAEALMEYEAAVKLAPDSAESRRNLGNALIGAGRPAEAAREIAEAIRLNPEWPEPKRLMAELLATTADKFVRNPRTALDYAQQADSMTDHKDPAALDTLAVALGANGMFEEAVKISNEAEKMATERGAKALEGLIREHRGLLEKREPVSANSK